jgi:hypothetical protein
MLCPTSEKFAITKPVEIALPDFHAGHPIGSVSRRASLHTVPKTQTVLSHGLNNRRQIIHLESDTIPSARFLRTSVRHRAPGPGDIHLRLFLIGLKNPVFISAIPALPN